MRAVLAFIALLAFAGSAAAQPTGLARGQRLVELHCSGCHATGVVGVSPNKAAPPFRDLHTRYQIDDLAEALAEGLLTGHPAMPEFRFEPNDVQAIITYLKSIQTHQEASTGELAGR
jgi:mono/diheme cytochrome c family protein